MQEVVKADPTKDHDIVGHGSAMRVGEAGVVLEDVAALEKGIM